MDLKEKKAGVYRFPWELARVKMLHQIFSRFSSGQGPFRLLDIGCGDGFVLESLSARGSVVQAHGLDIHLSEEDIAAMSTPQVQYFHDPAHLTGKYDVILLCDVLEHVDDDAAFLSRIVEDYAAPDALFIMTVPASQLLFSSHDIFLDHRRRYSAVRFEQVIKKAGLVLLDRGSLFLSLLLPRGAVCLKEKIFGRPKPGSLGLRGRRGGRIWTKVFELALSMDNAFLWGMSRMGVRFPGLTLWAVGRRRP